ncbi:MAG: TRAP transporter small permease subunit, partial [Candidatus Competibacteraceae bacterium]|nr:TRAP transporter small permease subunit [Candidatus Competibacteraceae bacterium]
MSEPPVIDRVSRILGDKLAWLFLVAAALSCYEVMMDWLFRAPTIWVHDSSIMLCSTAFLFGGAYALQRREHIRITVLYDYFSPWWQWVCDIVSLALTLVYL